MPRSGSRRWLAGLLATSFGLLAWAGCDEPNPDYDPDGGPVCQTGDRRCDGAWTQVCQPGDVPWVNERECWADTTCGAGMCLPDDPADTCEQESDCAASEVCTALVTSSAGTQLGTFCITSPNPTGTPSGQPCTYHEDCQTGWCFRSLCYEACASIDQCKNALHECGQLEVTIDGVRRSLDGCVPPS